MRFRIAVPTAGAMLAIFLTGNSAALANEAEPKWIQNSATQLCLEDYYSDVRLYPCDGSFEQLWRIVESNSTNEAGVTLQNIKSGDCLEVYSGEVRTYYCDGSAEQIWEPMVEDPRDVYPLLRNHSTNKCLDRNNSVTVEECQFGNPDQKWYWEGS